MIGMHVSGIAKIASDQKGNVLIHFRDGTPTIQKRAQVILDMNTQGNWIGGLEVIGGLLDFSLQRAVEPFHPSMPVLGETRNGKKLKVTYDPEANAAYFYLPYGARFQMLSDKERQRITEYSHSTNPTGAFAMDASGGLVSVLFPTADAIRSPETFLHLFDVVTLTTPSTLGSHPTD